MKMILVLLTISLCACNTTDKGLGISDEPISHQQWDRLVKKHVDPEGWVDYKGFLEDREQLQDYLNLLSNNYPNPETWSQEERLAYWINAYNAFTIELILRNYPLESIKDIKKLHIPLINTPWHIRFFDIGGEKFNLNEIEHDILRKKFDEPRIHFAINCASISCPKLRTEAYRAEKLEEQLNDQAHKFINNPYKNKIESDEIKISKIFSWFKGDFTENSTLIEYLNRYADTQINPDVSISYMEYDWGLNEK